MLPLTLVVRRCCRVDMVCHFHLQFDPLFEMRGQSCAPGC